MSDYIFLAPMLFGGIAVASILILLWIELLWKDPLETNDQERERMSIPLTGLYACSNCDRLDHVELVHPDKRWLCSDCDPEKEYHGQFPLVKYDPQKDLVINRPNNLSF